MVGVDGGGRVNLQAVVALAGVLKQAVHGVQHFVGQQEEPFSVPSQDGCKVMRGRVHEQLPAYQLQLPG